MAWITRTERGTWRVQIRKTGHRSQSRTFARKYDADRWATETEAKMNTGQTVDIRDLRHRTVRQLFEKFVAEVLPRRKGRRSDTVRINYLLGTADFMDRRLDQIRPVDFQQWKEERLQQVTPQTVNREMNTLSGVFTYAMKEWLLPLPGNPLHMVKRPGGAKVRRKRRPSPNEVTALVKQLGVVEPEPPTCTAQWAGYALLLAIETAMRIGEICTLERAGIHLDKRYAALLDTKNSDPRNVPLTRRAVALLKIMLAGGDTPQVKPTKQSRARRHLLVPHGAETLGLRFRESRAALGLPDLHFHDSRREAATRMSKKLSNVLELAAVTGHRDLKSLQVYFDPDATELAERLD